MTFMGNARAAMLAMLCLTVVRVTGAQETILHNFGHSSSGGVLIDAEGDVFATTQDAGIAIGGSIIELSPIAGGGWGVTVVYHFGAFPGDGLAPTGTLSSDGRGHLFGTTSQGGAYQNGTVFEISPTAGGGWSERVLYNFPSSGYPAAGSLVLDRQGNIYGTAQQGGTNNGNTGPFGYGTVFELSPSAGGRLVESVLHNFGEGSVDGVFPTPALTIDSAGDLYGTTFQGGAYSAGTVFKLTRLADGSWAEQILHDFNASPAQGDGYYPTTGLLLDTKGNLYGTTEYGGLRTTGAVFELSPLASGPWTEKLLYSFTTLDSGVNPSSGLTMDSAGNLYGTTTEGGLYQGAEPSGEPVGGGTVYTLRSQTDGSWIPTVLHNFPSNPTDGYNLLSGVVLDGRGDLYSSTALGGTLGFGTVFEIEGVATATVAGTTTMLGISPDSNLATGGSVTLTAIVSPATGPAIPQGMVTFSDPAGRSVTAPLVAGVATYKAVIPAAGSYSIVASYSGGPGFSGSKSPIVSRIVTAPHPQ